jgi:hypothetical protein
MRLLTHLKYSLILLGAVLLNSCDTWEKDINENPNDPPYVVPTTTAKSEEDPSQYMGDMIWQVISGWQYTTWNVASAVCEYHGKTMSLSQGNRHQAWHDLENIWSRNYKSPTYIKKVKKIAISQKNTKYQAIADIWEAYTFLGLTTLYGNIPYTQTMLDNPPITPVYDEQEYIYYTLLKKLKNAGKSIDNNASNVDAASDLIFYGNMRKWKKFANTLIVRYAMYMSDAAPDTAKAYLQEIVSDPQTYPLMESNDDNAVYHFDASDNNHKSQFYLLQKAKIEEAPFSNVFIERLISLKDPRLPVYARPVQSYHTNPNKNVVPSNGGTDKYAGHIYGITSDNAYAAAWNSGQNYASKLGEYFRTEDETGAATEECAKIPQLIAIYSELQFFLAEATEKGWITTSTTAKQYYENGIRASFDQYNALFTSTKYSNAFGNDALISVEEYLTQADANYDGGRDKLTLIAEQKWIASLFLQYEPYFDHRRTMLPALRASSGAAAYIMTGSGTKFPSRAAYPTSEYTNNYTNVMYASLNGFDIPVDGDDFATRNKALMWILKPKGQTWLQMPVFQEPAWPGDYPARSDDATYGTTFYTWYTNHWNTMFWWK